MANEFVLRGQIIEALEGTRDRKALIELIRRDPDLSAYQYVLQRASRELENVEQVETLLELPGLDTTSSEYKNAIANTFNDIAANEQTPNAFIVGMLFKHIKNDQRLKDGSLRSIFMAAATHGEDRPNAAIAKLLIENGANPDVKTEELQKTFFEEFRFSVRDVERVEKFKARLSL